MSEETGLSDKLTIAGTAFRRWHSSGSLECMSGGVWRSIPETAQIALLAVDGLIATEREACACIADHYGQKAEMRAGQHSNGKARDAALDKFEAAIEIASSIRSRSQKGEGK